MDFLKKYWKHILGLVVYTGLVVFISITLYKGYVSNQINNAIKETFNNVFSTSGDNDSADTNVLQENKNESIPIKQMKVDDTIITQDWEITLKGTEFSQDVIPPTPDTFYTHYQIKDTTNTYLVVKLNMKNISTIALYADNNISLKAIYDNKYEYTGFTTLLAQDNSDFDYTNITSIAPLTSRTLYYLVEMPKNITEDEKNIEIQLTAYQTKYTYDIIKSSPNAETNIDIQESKQSEANISSTTNETASSNTNKNVNSSKKKDTTEFSNPYEENIVYFYDASNSNNNQNSNSLDSYINNNISNTPIPELPSSDNNLDYLIEGIDY